MGVPVVPDVYWMFVTSLTTSSELFAATPQFLPSLSELNVYQDVFKTIPVATWLKNSVIVASGTTVLRIVLAILPAYALSRFRFFGLALLGFVLFATQMLPEAMLVVPLYAIFGDLGLLNTLTGLILANTAFTVPVIAWILKVVGEDPVLTPESGRMNVALDAADRAADVLIGLREAGISISSVSVDKPTLDEVFMALTGHDTGDAPSESPDTRELEAAR